MATLTASTNAILKLDLGEKGGGIRRIPLSKIWDTSTDSVSFTKILHLALNFGNIASSSATMAVTITYKDEEGDEITISTNDELTDAFLQFVNSVPPVLRSKAQFNECKCAGKPKGKKKNCKESINKVGGGAEAVQAALDTFVCVITQAVESLSKSIEALEGLARHKSKKVGSTKRSSFGAVGKKNKTETERKILAKKLMKEAMDEVSSRKESKTSEPKLEQKPTDEGLSITFTNILPPPPDIDRSFIHGRHTCDGCLVTPIIGLRYHALNLPDHDLCEKCIMTHTGTYILFEPTELERDRSLQTKWKRRQWRQNRQCGIIGAQRLNHTGDIAVCSVDSALKEAIRRSLSDAQSNKLEEKSEVVVVKQKESFDQEEQVEEVEEVSEESLDSVEFGLVHADDEEEEEEREEGECVRNGIVIAAEEFSVYVGKTEEEETFIFPPVFSPRQESIDPPMIDEQPEAKDSCSKTCFIQKEEEPSSPSSTFREEAEGQGEVAMAIGSALDLAASAIDAVVTEIDKPVITSNGIGSDSQSRTILESFETSPNCGAFSASSSSSTASLEEWQVLHKDGDASSDEMMAQAAQRLGSALFQSDVISDVTTKSEEVVSPSSSSQGFDSITSVPTEVQSVVPPVLLSRWDVELRQMREFGFLDDTKNIDALEHLEAAKMGVEDKDVVTVNDSINYLLSK